MSWSASFITLKCVRREVGSFCDLGCTPSFQPTVVRVRITLLYATETHAMLGPDRLGAPFTKSVVWSRNIIRPLVDPVTKQVRSGRAVHRHLVL